MFIALSLCPFPMKKAAILALSPLFSPKVPAEVCLTPDFCEYQIITSDHTIPHPSHRGGAEHKTER